jgi:hypothetical protein
MADDLATFGRVAVSLAKNPLGIIALLIVLVYAIAALVTWGASLEPASRLVLVYFIAVYPLVVLAAFLWLVVRHPTKLYAPQDYSDEATYLQVLQLTGVGAVQNVQLAAQEIQATREAVQPVLKPGTTDAELLALQFISRWNSPEMTARRREEGGFSSGMIAFFEEMAIAVDRRLADESMLREFFGRIVPVLWSRDKRWIEDLRKRSGRLIYEQYEKLALRWSDPHSS